MSFRFEFWASWYITGLNQISELKVIIVWICSDLSSSITSISICYGNQSYIRVKSYYRLICYEHSFSISSISIYYGNSIGHPSKKLLSLEFAQSFYIQFLESRYITWLNRTSKFKVIAVWICYELPFSILSVLIYNGTQSDIRVKSNCHLHLLRASVFNFERLNIL